MFNPLLIKAIKKANQVRTRLGLDMFEPVNIFDACITLEVTVRFVDINMEGMYISQDDGKNPTILLSNKRPFPRRCFTCAHELGHHIFGHGTKIDGLSEHSMDSPTYDQDEFLVDTFAGALLMPLPGIQAEFSKRNWIPQNVSPIEFFVIASIFGTGYKTLIKNCQTGKLIDESKAKLLLKTTPGKILDGLIGSDSPKSYFKIIDSFVSQPIIDLEVSNYIFFPNEFQIEGNHLKEYKTCEIGKVYVAVQPGIIRVTASENSYFIRIQNLEYVGLTENRHLENIID